MYCPSCGLQMTQELRYCPRCGANLSAPAPTDAPKNIVGPIWAVSLAVTLITLAGLGLLFAFSIVVVTRGAPLWGSVLGLLMFFLLGVLGIDVLLIRQLSRLLDIYNRTDTQPHRDAQGNRNELNERGMPQLEAIREPPSSVTEHTTRTFEPIPRERQTR